MDLEKLRGKIDVVDRKIVDHLNERVRLAAEIGHLKNEQGDPLYVPAREEEVFSKLSKLSDGPLEQGPLRAIYREIISASIALEKNLIIGYLGPEATYTHQAALKNFGNSLTYKPLKSIGEVFEEVERGDCDYGVVPIENSTEGSVFHSLDTLVETELTIIAQLCLPIRHCLISAHPLNEIQVVLSKDQALGQCREWLRRNLPDAQLVPVASTSSAVDRAKKESGSAAIAGALAAELHGLPVMAEGVQDMKKNVTRFLVIGRNSPARREEVSYKTSVVLSVKDMVGALQTALSPFSSRDLNLTKIESRPSRRKAWDYYFFVDVLGHRDDSLVGEALTELETTCPFVKCLGSYPDTGS
jgi:chorismate mutase / prephenate dehydratase